MENLCKVGEFLTFLLSTRPQKIKLSLIHTCLLDILDRKRLEISQGMCKIFSNLESIGEKDQLSTET